MRGKKISTWVDFFIKTKVKAKRMKQILLGAIWRIFSSESTIYGLQYLLYHDDLARLATQ